MRALKEMQRNYKTHRIANPHLESFEVWCLLCVEVYGCDKGEPLIKESWVEFQSAKKKVLGNKRFKKRNKRK